MNGSNRVPSPPVRSMLRRLARLADAGASDAALDAAIRLELIALAMQAEEEIGYLLPRAEDRRIRRPGVN